ncbi:MAG: hypothetical protein LUE98_07300 [Tannerellaceae bacterium]|nr:hypothetical protein [Tannerellaceae bacterium]
MTLRVETKKLRPPYKSEMPTTFPKTKDIDEKYKLDYKDDTIPRPYFQQSTILTSMTTEYSRETGCYGDFGRYVFQRVLSNWKVDVNGLSNLAVKWIFEKYGYHPDKHAEYDQNLGYTQTEDVKIERIGKKYQWIALHELLGKVSDNCEIRTSWSNRSTEYKGIWNKYVRDINIGCIDIEKDSTKELEPELTQENEYFVKPYYNNWDQSLSDWITNKQDLPSVKNIIQKVDKEGQQWLSLDSYIKWKEPKTIGEDKYHRPYRKIWYMVKSYLIHKNEKKEIIEWLNKQDFYGRWMPESESMNDLFSRENYWTPASLDEDTKSVLWERVDRGHFDVALTTHKSAGEFSHDKSGAHRIYEMPSKIIWNGMDMQYGKKEGIFQNSSNKIISRCVSPDEPLILKEVFLEFLNRKNLDIVWTVLGEKLFVGQNHCVDRSIINGVFTLEKGEVTGQINLKKQTLE